MVEQARRIGVRGWVRNRRDGSVESMVAGAPDAVEQMVLWAWQGPPAAEVSAADIQPGEGSFATFDERVTA